MTDEQLIAWGRNEDAMRKADLKGVTSAEGLLAAQVRAKQRREAVGLSMSQVIAAVKAAQRSPVST